MNLAVLDAAHAAVRVHREVALVPARRAGEPFELVEVLVVARGEPQAVRLVEVVLKHLVGDLGAHGHVLRPEFELVVLLVAQARLVHPRRVREVPHVADLQQRGHVAADAVRPVRREPERRQDAPVPVAETEEHSGWRGRVHACEDTE